MTTPRAGGGRDFTNPGKIRVKKQRVPIGAKPRKLATGRTRKKNLRLVNLRKAASEKRRREGVPPRLDKLGFNETKRGGIRDGDSLLIESNAPFGHGVSHLIAQDTRVCWSPLKMYPNTMNVKSKEGRPNGERDTLQQNGRSGREERERGLRVRKQMDSADLTLAPMVKDPPKRLLNSHQLSVKTGAVATRRERMGHRGQAPLTGGNHARPTTTRRPRHRAIGPEIQISGRKIRIRQVKDAEPERRRKRGRTRKIKIGSKGEAREGTPRRKRSKQTKRRAGLGRIKNRVADTGTAPRGSALQSLPRLGLSNTRNGKGGWKTKSPLIERES